MLIVNAVSTKDSKMIAGHLIQAAILMSYYWGLFLITETQPLTDTPMMEGAGWGPSG